MDLCLEPTIAFYRCPSHLNLTLLSQSKKAFTPLQTHAWPELSLFPQILWSTTQLVTGLPNFLKGLHLLLFPAHVLAPVSKAFALLLLRLFGSSVHSMFCSDPNQKNEILRLFHLKIIKCLLASCYDLSDDLRDIQSSVLIKLRLIVGVCSIQYVVCMASCSVEWSMHYII